MTKLFGTRLKGWVCDLIRFRLDKLESENYFKLLDGLNICSLGFYDKDLGSQHLNPNW